MVKHTEPKPAKIAKLTGIQKSISAFFSDAGSSSASPTAANVSLHGEKEKSSPRSLQATQFNIASSKFIALVIGSAIINDTLFFVRLC